MRLSLFASISGRALQRLSPQLKRYVPRDNILKYQIGFIMTLLLCTSLEASQLTAIEKKQRLLVSRFYEVLEIFPKRCPQTVRNAYLQTVEKYEKSYPEFIALIKKSKFRSYAIKHFSVISPVSEKTCLYFKEALDMEVDTEKGQKSTYKNIEVMRYAAPEAAKEQQAKEVTFRKGLIPHVWSGHKILEISAESCANKGKDVLERLGFNKIIKNKYFIYGNHGNNRGVIKCAQITGSTFVYTIVSGSNVKDVEALRNEIMWKL